MIQKNSIIQLIACGILVLCVVASAGLATALAAEAGRAQLVYTDEASEGDPPEIALGIALGAFRGLFVNYLWLRANRLKEEGKFYEAIELSKAITRLQPRFPRVWAFHAWNMAYNISVATNTGSERWMWVRAGVDILRNEAIPRNPNDVLLHKELAWIFIHKIQGWSDDANHYYKRQLAKEWTILLGEQPDRQTALSRDDAIDLLVEWLDPIVRTPRTLRAVIETELEDRRNAGEESPRSEVQRLVDQIDAEAGLGLDFNLLTLVAYHAARRRAWFSDDPEFTEEGAFRSEAIEALLENEAYADAWSRLLPFVRRKLLVEDYNMEPERMQRYTRETGPLDWRHAASHAFYWSRRGVEEGLERQSTTQFTTLNTDRVTLHAIQELFRFGKINFDLLAENEYFVLPDLDFTDTYQTVLADIAHRGGNQADTNRGWTMYKAGYENFLRDVIRVYYHRGDYAAAEHYHEVLRTTDMRTSHDPDTELELQLPLKEFVEKQLPDDRLSIPQVALGEIDAALTQAFLEGLLEGERRVFVAQMEYAYEIWKRFRKEQNIRTFPDPETMRMAEFVGEEFPVIVVRKLVDLLSGGRVGWVMREGVSNMVGGGAGFVGNYQSGRLFRILPLDMQLAVYDDLRTAMTSRQNVSEEVFNEYWPEPPGMEEFRQRRSQEFQNSDRWMRRQVEFLKQ